MQRAPEKVSLPPLSGGLIANDGSFFPQARVRRGSRAGLFDDVLGYGWCIVTVNPSLLDGLPPTVAAVRQKTSRIAVIGDQATDQALSGLDGVYAAWFRAHACEAEVVRPDWYVCGTVHGSTAEASAALQTMVQTLLGRLSLGAAE